MWKKELEITNVKANHTLDQRYGRSTIDRIFGIKQINEKAMEFGLILWYMFVDFTAAYDSIYRDSVYSDMAELFIPRKLINLTKITMGRTICIVKCNNMVS